MKPNSTKCCVACKYMHDECPTMTDCPCKCHQKEKCEHIFNTEQDGLCLKCGMEEKHNLRLTPTKEKCEEPVAVVVNKIEARNAGITDEEIAEAEQTETRLLKDFGYVQIYLSKFIPAVPTPTIINELEERFEEKFPPEWWKGFGTTDDIDKMGISGILAFIKEEKLASYKQGMYDAGEQWSKKILELTKNK